MDKERSFSRLRMTGVFCEEGEALPLAVHGVSFSA